jgi:hypothetical protein
MKPEIGHLLLIKTFYAYHGVNKDRPFGNVSQFSNAISNKLTAIGKPTFSAKTLMNYFKKFTENNFETLSTSGQVTNALADYCDYNDFNLFKKNPPTYSDDDIIYAFEEMQLQKVVDYFNGNTNNTFQYKVDDVVFEDLEFNQSGVEINCITSRLFWAAKHIPERQNEIIKMGNTYNYILTESHGNNYKRRIYDCFRENDKLRERINIRSLHRSELIVNTDYIYHVYDKTGILFPISNDIVIYRKKDTTGIYKFHMGIIGTRITETHKSENFSIRIEDDRAQDIYTWFLAVWDTIKTNDE